MSCKLFNARSLCNKLTTLYMLLNSAKYDIIFVTETWLHSDFPDSLLLPNYVFRKVRGGGYGGVAIFVKNSLKAVFVDLDPVFLSLECIVLDLLVSGYPCIRCVCFIGK